jgi:hypothetical protein
MCAFCGSRLFLKSEVGLVGWELNSSMLAGALDAYRAMLLEACAARPDAPIVPAPEPPAPTVTVPAPTVAAPTQLAVWGPERVIFVPPQDEARA